ncbi:MAG: hypothetical protein JWM05_2417, partial [Acidimicrobiales bacterium]|nr:hypothetical protein [Acidimicrobiales bacterium]
MKDRLGYQPALDGLRAVAVSAVVLYHGGVSWGRGGFLGVDVFFVISGFLITTLLVEEWRATGRIALGEFWARRVRRLLPALALVLVAVAAYAALLAPDVTRRALRADGLATLFYVANWRLVLSHQSYFEQLAGPSPLLHTWSLAVEEQWYLVWPLLVAAVAAVGHRVGDRRGALAFERATGRGPRPSRLAHGPEDGRGAPADPPAGPAAAGPQRRGPGGLGWCAGAALAAAAASGVWMARLVPVGGDTSRAYYGTDTRVQALLVGAALAFALQRWPIGGRAATRLVGGLGVLGFVGGVVLIVAVDDRTRWMYHGGFALCALCWGAVTAASLAVVGGPMSRVLAVRPLVALGRISYGVYLWNWPAVVVLTPERTGLGAGPLFALRVATTLAAAALSYRLVERPIRAGQLTRLRWWRPRPVALGAVALTALLLVVATIGAPAPLR